MERDLPPPQPIYAPTQTKPFEMKKQQLVLLLLLLFVSLAVHAPTTVSVTCNPTELSSCLGPILYGNAPSSTCCQKLKEQQPCFCQYMKNPTYKGIITSANANKTATTCGVPGPSC
ncbi:hypothetical protein QJS04_geneDACA018726 [Acorus gramineus]|uniref:Bifunctional inhibitor/plant lipid transfer protein/seed storage helical domain-containing protein n=1 Tax=Acorus gramineus TaxID=55184 RepID=A0AAV9A420_ACOGR|nr:hypothetical protein QJS04_geneDACA018726 [Acorus gramineus]